MLLLTPPHPLPLPRIRSSICKTCGTPLFCVQSKVSKIVGTDDDDEERDKVLVQSLLDLKDTMDALVAAAFTASEGFSTTLRASIEACVNTRQDRPAELVAKFIDARMRTGGKGVEGEAHTEAVFDKVMALFRCIYGKDVFEAFYKKDLAKRLLLGRSQSTDLEKSMLQRLKAECGASYASKLECMFKDIDLSKDVNARFAQGGVVAGGGSGGGGVGASEGGGAGQHPGGGVLVVGRSTCTCTS